MENKVKVTADPNGNVIVTSSRNNKYGYIRVEQTRVLIDEQGFVSRKMLSALVTGLIADLKSFGWQDQQEIPGKIIIKESMVPFNMKRPESNYKIAGNSGVVCCVDNKPIYRKHIFSYDTNATDISINHNNQDQIQAARNAQIEDADILNEDSNDTFKL